MRQNNRLRLRADLQTVLCIITALAVDVRPHVAQAADETSRPWRVEGSVILTPTSVVKPSSAPQLGLGVAGYYRLWYALLGAVADANVQLSTADWAHYYLGGAAGPSIDLGSLFTVDALAEAGLHSIQDIGSDATRGWWPSHRMDSASADFAYVGGRLGFSIRVMPAGPAYGRLLLGASLGYRHDLGAPVTRNEFDTWPSCWVNCDNQSPTPVATYQAGGTNLTAAIRTAIEF